LFSSTKERYIKKIPYVLAALATIAIAAPAAAQDKPTMKDGMHDGRQEGMRKGMGIRQQICATDWKYTIVIT
jgi:Spy/CpxP family protein refolding chaperone